MLSPAKKRIYEFIQAFIEDQGYAPSLSQIAQGVGVRSKSIISRHVHALANEGLIQLSGNGHRQIRLQEEDQRNKYLIPLLGKVAAGSPIEAVEDEQFIDLIELLKIGNPDHFSLKVRGDSMIDAGILDGDCVLFQKNHRPPEGSIVIALLDQQTATLKRIHYQPPSEICLIPANPHLHPVCYPAERVHIQGIMIGLVRSV